MRRSQVVNTASKSVIKSGGFTLLELLISLTIFALVAAMAYSGLNNVLIARDQTQLKSQQLAQLQTAIQLMSRDIEQSIDRGVRDEFGTDTPIPALKGNQFGDYLLEFTRTGWVNPMNLPRSNLLRVAYTLKDKKLIRSIWYVLDRAQDSARYDSVLLDGIKNLEFFYMDEKKEWQRSWPPDTTLSGGSSSTQANQPPPSLPHAVRVEVDTEAFGKVERWFHMPG